MASSVSEAETGMAPEYWAEFVVGAVPLVV